MLRNSAAERFLFMLCLDVLDLGSFVSSHWSMRHCPLYLQMTVSSFPAVRGRLLLRMTRGSLVVRCVQLAGIVPTSDFYSPMIFQIVWIANQVTLTRPHRNSAQADATELFYKVDTDNSGVMNAETETFETYLLGSYLFAERPGDVTKTKLASILYSDRVQTLLRGLFAIDWTQIPARTYCSRKMRKKWPDPFDVRF